MALLEAARGALLVLIAGALSTSARAEPVVIVHPSCPISRLAPDDARRLLLGEELSWRNGDATQLVELRSEARSRFPCCCCTARATRAPSRARSTRCARRYTPLRQVRAAVARMPGAFAVIDSTSADTTVKIVYRTSGKG